MAYSYPVTQDTYENKNTDIIHTLSYGPIIYYGGPLHNLVPIIRQRPYFMVMLIFYHLKTNYLR